MYGELPLKFQSINCIYTCIRDVHIAWINVRDTSREHSQFIDKYPISLEKQCLTIQA